MQSETLVSSVDCTAMAADSKLISELTTLPGLWKNKQSLQAIGARLAEHAAELERAPTGVRGGESESDLDTESAGTTHVAIPTCA